MRCLWSCETDMPIAIDGSLRNRVEPITLKTMIQTLNESVTLTKSDRLFQIVDNNEKHEMF